MTYPEMFQDPTTGMQYPVVGGVPIVPGSSGAGLAASGGQSADVVDYSSGSPVIGKWDAGTGVITPVTYTPVQRAAMNVVDQAVKGGATYSQIGSEISKAFPTGLPSDTPGPTGFAAIQNALPTLQAWWHESPLNPLNIRPETRLGKELLGMNMPLGWLGKSVDFLAKGVKDVYGLTPIALLEPWLIESWGKTPSLLDATVPPTIQKIISDTNPKGYADMQKYLGNSRPNDLAVNVMYTVADIATTKAVLKAIKPGFVAIKDWLISPAGKTFVKDVAKAGVQGVATGGVIKSMIKGANLNVTAPPAEVTVNGMSGGPGGAGGDATSGGDSSGITQSQLDAMLAQMRSDNNAAIQLLTQALAAKDQALADALNQGKSLMQAILAGTAGGVGKGVGEAVINNPPIIVPPSTVTIEMPKGGPNLTQGGGGGSGRPAQLAALKKQRVSVPIKKKKRRGQILGLAAQVRSDTDAYPTLI